MARKNMKTTNKREGRQAIGLVVINQSLEKWRAFLAKSGKTCFDRIHPESFEYFRKRTQLQQAVTGSFHVPLSTIEQAILAQAIVCALRDDHPRMTITVKETGEVIQPPASIVESGIDAKIDAIHWSMSIAACLPLEMGSKFWFNLDNGTMEVADQVALDAFWAIDKKFKDHEIAQKATEEKHDAQ